MASLYIHIPFCVKKCAYCDFASYAGREGDMARYLSAVAREMGAAAARYGRLKIETVFIGGGTPSLMTAEQISTLMRHVQNYFDVDPRAEITMEANPGTVAPDLLRACKEAGINRLSFGVQAAQEELLALLGRIHRFEDAKSAFHLAREAGFGNISLDLIYALPRQTMADWTQTLSAALALEPEHLSCYSLIVEPGTILAKKIACGELSVPGEDAALAMQHSASDLLARAGYLRYEISNYAKPGYESRHNAVYWTRGDYLGVGCGAHSLMQNERFQNSADLDGYLSGEVGIDRQILSLPEQREEAVMLETRMARGLDLVGYQRRYDEDFYAVHRAQVEKLRALGLIDLNNQRLALTPRGMDVQSAVVVELLA